MNTRKKSVTGRIVALFAALGMLVLSSGVALLVSAAPANAADTCPDGGDWIKVDGLSSLTHTIDAPADKLIAEVCAKSSTNLVQLPLNPPQASYEFDSEALGLLGPQGQAQELSHISYRLVDVPEEEPPVEEPPAEEPPAEQPPVVEPPVVDPPANKPPTTSSTIVTPTVVNAGLGDVAGDLRSEQGLALIAAGTVMLLGAASFGLIGTGRRMARI
jgi:hypothetical protein